MLLCISRGLVVFQSIIEYHNKSNEAPRWAGIMKKSEGRTSCDILPLKTLHPLVDFYMNFVGSQYNICQKVYRFEPVTQQPQLDAATIELRTPFWPLFTSGWRKSWRADRNRVEETPRSRNRYTPDRELNTWTPSNFIINLQFSLLQLSGAGIDTPQTGSRTPGHQNCW